MTRILGRYLIPLCLALSGLETATAQSDVPQSYSPEDLDAAFSKDTLVIEASLHACHRFHVWVARTRPQLSRGLMFVRHLEPYTGMLFVYGEPRPVSMWMKNTYIPLDMLYIRADGTISSIVDNTEPMSLDSIRSIEPVSFVLELAGGDAEALMLQPGDRVVWSDPP